MFYVILAVFSTISPSRLYAESTMQLIEGNVESVDSSEHQITVAATDAETKLAKIYQVHVDLATKFVQIQNLGGIKASDTVRIDFFQGAGGQFIASRLELIKSAHDQKSNDKAKSSLGEHNKAENNKAFF